MTRKMLVSEVWVAILLIVVLLGFCRFSVLSMPMRVEMVLIVSLISVVLAFLGLVWREKSKDERENLHRLQAGRLSFLVGTIVLTTGIIVQSLNHEIDHWLVATLVVMILSKIGSRVYSRLRY